MSLPTERLYKYIEKKPNIPKIPSLFIWKKVFLSAKRIKSFPSYTCKKTSYANIKHEPKYQNPFFPKLKKADKNATTLNVMKKFQCTPYSDT